MECLLAGKAEDILFLSIWDDEGDGAVVSEQSSAVREQLGVGQSVGMSRQGALRVGSSQTVLEERRVAYDKVV